VEAPREGGRLTKYHPYPEIAALGLATFQGEVVFLKDYLNEHMQIGEFRYADLSLLAQVN
jgi:hypothetical protein